MQIPNNILIDDLLDRTQRATEKVKEMKQLSYDGLNYKRRPEEWSILECIEHLNLYGDFYLPEIEKKVLTGRKNTKKKVFKSGLIGNYFANLMQVNEGQIKKMKSPNDKNPLNSDLTTTTLDRFLKQQELLKSLLMKARNIDMTSAKARISLTNLLRLRLGDTFRFFVYHIERHVLQANKQVERNALVINEEKRVIKEQA